MQPLRFTFIPHGGVPTPRSGNHCVKEVISLIKDLAAQRVVENFQQDWDSLVEDVVWFQRGNTCFPICINHTWKRKSTPPSRIGSGSSSGPGRGSPARRSSIKLYLCRSVVWHQLLVLPFNFPPGCFLRVVLCVELNSAAILAYFGHKDDRQKYGGSQNCLTDNILYKSF